jgi:hypothetical protein
VRCGATETFRSDSRGDWSSSGSRKGGGVAVSAWCPLGECTFFAAIADCLCELGENEAAATMGVPFDHMPAAALESHFGAAGFEAIAIERIRRDLVFEGGIDQAYDTILATPLAPKLAEFSEARRTRFRDLFTEAVGRFTESGVTTASLASLVLTARRTADPKRGS